MNALRRIVSGSRPSRPWLALLMIFAAAVMLMAATNDPGGQRFDRIGHNLMCQCGCGQVLLECNHVGCSTSESMRKELQGAIERGDTDKIVLAAFTEKYGPTVLAAPTTTGFNRVAWLMPPLICLAALGAVVAVVLMWRRRSLQAPPPPPPAVELDEFRRRAREETSL